MASYLFEKSSAFIKQKLLYSSMEQDEEDFLRNGKYVLVGTNAAAFYLTDILCMEAPIEVIAPEETRLKLIRGFSMLENKADKLPRKKHGNIPL